MDFPNLNALLAKIPAEWDRKDFVLCGSAALAFRGVRDVQDLDVLIKPYLWPGKAHEVGQTREAAYETARMVLRMDSGIDVFDALPRLGPDTRDAFEAAEWFEGFQVLNMRHVLAIKAACFRDSASDRDDMISLAYLIRSEEIALEAPKGFAVPL